MPSLQRNWQAAKDKIQKELELGRIAGPFDTRPIPTLRCSPLALVPKSESGKFRLIHHLSFPEGGSINDFISDKSAKVTYTKFDEAISRIASWGPNALVAKADISNAFRLLPVNKSDFDLLGFTFEGKYYFDMNVPMGCRISSRLFEEFSTFLNWFLNGWNKAHNTDHYCDDFVFSGPAGSPKCQLALDHFRTLCKFLGIPIAEEKTVAPCTRITFLGLGIDTVTQQVKIPKKKLAECKRRLKNIARKSRVTLKQLQSLLGYLNFLCRAIAGGRAFLQRLVALTRGKSKKGQKNQNRSRGQS